MTAVRTLAWALVYAVIVSAAVIVARGDMPFVYQGF
jgi:hypothetical protein